MTAPRQDWLTVVVAAVLLGVRPDSVRAAIRYGSLPARKFGRDWVLEAEDIERYRVARGPGPGRGGYPPACLVLRRAKKA